MPLFASCKKEEVSGPIITITIDISNAKPLIGEIRIDKANVMKFRKGSDHASSKSDLLLEPIYGPRSADDRTEILVGYKVGSLSSGIADVVIIGGETGGWNLKTSSTYQGELQVDVSFQKGKASRRFKVLPGESLVDLKKTNSL